MKHKNRGFTLVELLIVILIIAVLAGLSLTAFVGSQKTARDARRKSDIEQVRSALELYRSDNGYYPNTGAGAWTNASAIAVLVSEGYISVIPADPANTNPYAYIALNLAGGRYYGYCLAAAMEYSANAYDNCASNHANAAYNYEIANP